MWKNTVYIIINCRRAYQLRPEEEEEEEECREEPEGEAGDDSADDDDAAHHVINYDARHLDPADSKR